MNAIAARPLIEAPASDTYYRYETLAYVAAHDAVLNCDYAFVAYKETERSGDWRVRINSRARAERLYDERVWCSRSGLGLQTAGAVFERAAMHSKARETSAHGKSWFRWGYSFAPTVEDSRHIEFRVHVHNGQPHEIEIYLQLRKFDGSADEVQSVRFPWPAA